MAVDGLDAVAQYINAGGNTEGYDLDEFEADIIRLASPDQPKAGPAISEAVLNSRVADVLRVKAHLGLIGDDPRAYVDPAWAARWNNAPEHRQLAKEAAEQAQVLLQNRPVVPAGQKTGTPILPVAKGAVKTVAVIGGNADNPRFGDYTAAEHHRGGNINNHNAVGVLEAVKAALPSADITHVVGVGIQGNVNNDDATLPLAQHGCGADGGSEVIRSHHFTTADGEVGVTGEYYNNPHGDFSGKPMITRVDSALSFHWYHWGPDGGSRTMAWGGEPTMFSAFSARWRGKLTPMASVAGSFNILAKGAYGGQAFGGAKLLVDGKVLIDVWDNTSSATSASFEFKTGIAIDIELWYRKGPGNGNIELQWDLWGAAGAVNGIPNAVAAARSSDLAIVVVGGSSSSSNEGIDRASLGLVGNQLDLVKSVHAACAASGTPMVLVLVGGKPVAEPWIERHVDAVIFSGEAGQAQGTAAVDVIFGAINPSGKLPITFPKGAETLPAYYSAHGGDQSSSWCDFGDASAPLWSFGHGLSFTEFSYSALVIKDRAVPADGTVEVSFTVRNVGQVAGVETAQLYVRDAVASVTTPKLQLKGFKRVFLESGRSAEVSIEIDVADELWLINRAYESVVEPGLFHVHVGGGSDALKLTGNFSVV